MIFADDFEERHKLAWRGEHAQLDPNNPLLEPKYPWDSAVVCCGHGTALKDPIDGKLKIWSPSIAEDLDLGRGETQFRLTYIESDDGVEWKRPELGICPFPGHEKTNILMDFDSGGRPTYASVFIDADANSEEPYEMFVFRDAYFRNKNLCVAGLGQQAGKDWLDALQKYWGLYRYRSKDGLHWRPVEGPIKLKSGDTCYIHKDSELGYVAHHKDGLPAPPGGSVAYDIAPGEIRVNFRRTSPDGTDWTDRAFMMMADHRDMQGDQIMEVGRYPYRDGFIGLTGVYHATSQSLDLHFAASRDKGETWWRPIPRRACMPNAPLGEYGGGMYFPMRTMVEQEGRLYVYYAALDALHGDLYATDPSWMHFHGAFCRASWEVGRMWAAVSAEGGMCPGYLTTRKLSDSEGKKLIVNAKTRPQGSVEAELLDESKKVIAGFSRADCRPIQGDEKFGVITWKGNTVCPKNAVHLRLWITKAFLYGFEWCAE